MAKKQKAVVVANDPGDEFKLEQESAQLINPDEETQLAPDELYPEVGLVTGHTTKAVALKPQADAELAERLLETVDSLNTFTDIKLPIIKLKNGVGFFPRDGEPVETFTGTIIYTKQSNAYFEGRYKEGDTSPPRCFSSNGNVPDGKDPISPNCPACPKNQFGSAKDGGEGKACKNTRPTFILVDNPDNPDSLSIIPKVLRISPTSLGLVREYITGVTADYDSYANVKTKFTVFKKQESQAYWNIKFSVAKKLNPQEKANVVAVRTKWLPYMQSGFFSVDEMDATPTAEMKTASPSATSDVEF